eukprot:m.69376 g.69376  ORF g.69376 m.69376 type:complete len:169 (-) comp24083_c0_seq1:227-733(-)
MGFCKKHTPIVVVFNLVLAAVSWICFVIAFALESTNPERPADWSKGIEKFTWYCFCFLGATAMALVILYLVQKQVTGHAYALFATALALLMAGGPLNESGHFIWKCQQDDYAGVGCREETYDNMAMIFSTVLVYSTCMSIVTLVTTMFENKPKFSLRGARGVIEDPLV